MGTNNSPEGLDKGFTHCFVVTLPMNRVARNTCHIRSTRNSWNC